jgi:pimeloyl-ACP methyl ester carboxylesterase
MQSITMPWGRMAYTDSGGDALPVVLLHGTGCDTADWAPMLDAMHAEARIIGVDFRGHGGSDASVGPMTFGDLASDVLALVDHLKLWRYLLVGHSLGAMVATQVAAQSLQAAGIVMFEGWTNSAAGEAFTGDRTLGRLDAAARDAIQKKDEAILARFRAEDWQSLVRSGSAFNSFDYLAGATIPIFEVWGDLGRTDDAAARLQIPPNPCITLSWIHGAGHYLPHERPRECASICARAIEGVTPNR